MDNGSIQISLATLLIACGGGFVSLILAILGYQSKMMIENINKSIQTLFEYNDDLEKLLGNLRSDFEALKAEHKVRHEK